ncbi:hypothetical protein [uncultured Chryseobacterium sp.]|uniref:hypothetical protein n=1 Tax=uncultured Chryseobacterium sp. TaxID=259322 RepID=UPI0025F31815|nr:hypothetical protein [uncultured Chryseobacterium sp.]
MAEERTKIHFPKGEGIKIIKTLADARVNDSIYILPIDRKSAQIIIVDAAGNKRKLGGVVLPSNIALTDLFDEGGKITTVGNSYLKTQIDNIISVLKLKIEARILEVNAGTEATISTLRIDVNKSIEDLLEEFRSILSSNDINLDELQEIVDYIKQNREQIELLQEVIIGSTTDDKIQLTGDYSTWGALTRQNQFNDIVYDKLQQVDSGKFRHQEIVTTNSSIVHGLHTFDFVCEAYDTVTLYKLPVKVKIKDENTIDIEFDSQPVNAIQITIRKI